MTNLVQNTTWFAKLYGVTECVTRHDNNRTCVQKKYGSHPNGRNGSTGMPIYVGGNWQFGKVLDKAIYTVSVNLLEDNVNFQCKFTRSQ